MVEWGMNRRGYQEYLKSSHWKRTRNLAMSRGRHRCYVCRDGHSILHVHHACYKRLYTERPSDLVVLCEPCHQRAHAIVAAGEAPLKVAHISLRREWLTLNRPGSLARNPVAVMDDPIPDRDSVVGHLGDYSDSRAY